MKIKILLICIGIVIIGLGVRYGIASHTAESPVVLGTIDNSSTTITVSTSTTSSPPVEPATFQPGAEMLAQAVLARKDEAASTVLAQTKEASKHDDTPLPVDPAPGAYTYDAAVCRTFDTTKYRCLAAYYEGLVKKYGSVTAVNDMKQRFQTDTEVMAKCHPLMHVIGQTASDSYKTVSEAYLHGDAFCWSGYYHGVLEGVIARIGLANLPSQLNTICADIPGKEKYSFDYFNCVHGLGHGIMEALHDEVFESLPMCDNLIGNWEQSSCYSGIFMENIIANDNLSGQKQASKFLKPTEPLYPCTAVDTRYKEQCYLGQTSYALQVTHYNFAQVFALCTTVEQPFRDICNQSMGRDVANQAHHANTRTKELCFLPEDIQDRKNCVVGAVKEIISYYHAKTQADDFCSLFEDDYRLDCQATADSYYTLF